MKVAVTGHTSGIGKACFEHFHAAGFSRTNGFDINSPDKIVEHCRDIDVFINSAHGGFGQATMLKAIFNSWRYQPKHIFNIGVDKVSLKSWELVSETYPVEKIAAHSMCEELQALARSCRITNICLGFVENYGGDIEFNDIVETIHYIYNKPYEIKRIHIGNGVKRTAVND